LVIDIVDTTFVRGQFGLFAERGHVAFDVVAMTTTELNEIYPSPPTDKPHCADFSFGFYSVAPTQMDEVRARGANIVQNYGSDQLGKVASAAVAGVRSLAHIGTYSIKNPVLSDEEDVAKAIHLFSKMPNIAWWELLEELRPWISDDMLELTNLWNWAQRYDPHW
jgi:hypothetical protein